MAIQYCPGTAIISATGTGASMNIPCASIPTAVLVYNITDAEEMYWDNTLTSGYGYKASGLVTTGGITPSPAGATWSGFNLGTDTINRAGSLLKIVAFF